MSRATKVLQTGYAAIKWFHKPVPIGSTVKKGGAATRKRKGKSARSRRQRQHKQYGGNKYILTDYIPETLNIPSADFEAAWPTAKRLERLGIGRFSVVYKYKIAGKFVICKFVNAYIPVNNANRNITTQTIFKLINNEITALSELTRHADAAKYIPRFVGLMKKLHTHSGGQFRLKIPALSLRPKSDEYEYIIISDYLTGSTLGNLYTADPRRFTPEFIEKLHADFGAALAAIHGAGWMHRDIHPQNLYVELDEAGSYIRPLLIDFGTAARIGEYADVIGADKYQSERAKYSPEGYKPEFDFDSLDISLSHLKSPPPVIPPIRTPSPGANLSETNNENNNAHTLEPPTKKRRLPNLNTAPQ
jgi:serine/threonine protein kinase